MKTFTQSLLVLLHLICLFTANNDGATPGERLCGDNVCSVPISRAKTLVRYLSPEKGRVSFEKGVEVEVLSKSNNVWSIKVGDKIGYAPRSFLKELKVIIPGKDLVTVSEILPSDPVRVETTQNESVDMVNGKTEEIPAGSGSLLSFPSMASAEAVDGQPGSLPTPSSPQFEVMDGTTIWMDPVPPVQESQFYPPDKEPGLTVQESVPDKPLTDPLPSSEAIEISIKSSTDTALNSPQAADTVVNDSNLDGSNVTPPSVGDDQLYTPEPVQDSSAVTSVESTTEIPLDEVTVNISEAEASTDVLSEVTTEASVERMTIEAAEEVTTEAQEIEPTQSGIISNLWNTMFSGDGTEESSQENEEGDGEDEGDEEEEEDDGSEGEEENSQEVMNDTLADSNKSEVSVNEPVKIQSTPFTPSDSINQEENIPKIAVDSVPQILPPPLMDLSSSFPVVPPSELEGSVRTPRQADNPSEEVTSEEQEMLKENHGGEQQSKQEEGQESKQLETEKTQEEEEQFKVQQEEEAKRQQEEQLRLQQEEELKTQQEEQLRLQQEEQLRLQQEEELKAQQEAQLKLQQEEQLRLQQEEQLRLQQEEQLRLQQEEELKMQQEAQLKLQQEEQLRLQQEEQLRLQQEEEVKRQQEEHLKLQEEEQLKRQQEDEAKRQQEEQLRLQHEEEQKRLQEIEAANLKSLQEEQEIYRQNQEKQRVREEEMKRLAEEAEKMKVKEREIMGEGTGDVVEIIHKDETPSAQDEENAGGMFSWFTGFFGKDPEPAAIESNEASTHEHESHPSESQPSSPPTQYYHEHPHVWSAAEQTTCSAQEAGCEMKEEVSTEDAGYLFDWIQAPSLDVILLRLAATSIVLFLGAFSFYFLRKKHVDSSLVAHINELEKQLLVASKEAIIWSEKASTVDSTVNSEEVNALQEELESYRLARADLEEQVSTLERELEEATETGIELNRLLSETLEASKGKAHAGLAASVERLQQQLDSQRDKVDSLTRSLKSTSAENESLKSSVAESKERVSALEAELVAAAEIASTLRREREEANVLSAQQLQQVQSRLEEALSTKVLEESRLASELSAFKLKVETLRSSLSMKDSEVKALQDTLKELEAVGSNADQFLDVSKVKAELEHTKKDRDAYQEKLNNEEKANIGLQERIENITVTLKNLEEKVDISEKLKEEAETRLAVLSNYFKEKEEQLLKELGLKEAIVAQHRGDESTVIKHLQLLQEEVDTYRAQNESLKAEILDQERGFKGQIATLEKKAHDNWMSARQAERRLEDARQEAAQLRNRLTLVEKSNADPNSRLDANGEGGVASPVMMMPLPPLGDLETPPPLPPFMFSPPPFPPPFMPPPLPPHPMGRPPPLGRMSSPPPPPLGQFSPPPPPYDRLGRSSRSPSPPPHRYHHRSPPPQQWDEPRSSFRPFPKPSPKKPTDHRNHKGPLHSSGHLNESMDKSREHV